MIDESHLCTGTGTGAAYAILDMVGVHSKLVFITGTPIQNSVNDLANSLHMLAPDRFPVHNLVDLYNLTSQTRGVVEAGLEQLRKDFSPFVDRLLLSDTTLMHGIPLHDMVLWLNLDAEQSQFYEFLCEMAE